MSGSRTSSSGPGALPPELDPRAPTPGRRSRRAEPAPRATGSHGDRRTLLVLGGLMAAGLLLVGVLGLALAGLSDNVIGGAVRSAASVAVPGADDEPEPSASADPVEPSAPTEPSEQPAADLLAGATVSAFDPLGDDDEHAAELPRATDGDPGTAWTTDRYSSASFGGLKDGVGLLVDLGSPQQVAAATVTLASPGTRLELRAGDDLASLTTVATAGSSDGEVALTPAEPVTARYVVVWMTELGPAAGGGFRGEVAELSLR